MTNLQQIADEVNVSVSLVSKVLNKRMGNTGARPELTERIEATAKRLGYRPNANAVALKQGKHQVVAVLIHRHGSPGSGLVEDLLSGIATATRARQQRQSILFYEDVADFSRQAATLEGSSIDGMLISGVRHPSLMDEVVGIQQRGTPVVTVFNRPISDAVPNVGMPDDGIIATSMHHLLALGRRNILHVSSLKDREEGYHRSLVEAGRPPADSGLVYYERGDDTTFVIENGERAVRRAFEQGVAFDAVCAQSDTQALGALHELIRRGRRVPEDVLITGVDDSPFARTAIVPLTTVSQRYEERGRLAVRLLADLIERKPVKSIELEPQLTVRRSTALSALKP